MTRLHPHDYPALSINPSLTPSGNDITSGLEGMHKSYAWITSNPLETPLPSIPRLHRFVTHHGEILPPEPREEVQPRQQREG